MASSENVAEFVELSPENYFTRYYVIALDDFTNYKKSNIRCKHNINTLRNYADAASKENKTTYEVLMNDFYKLFLDLENIPESEPNMYKRIISTFADYAGIKLDVVPYGITMNTGSHHPGLSYHVIFNLTIHRDNLRNLVKRFKIKYPDFAGYVDSGIYTRNRLFRLPEQIGLVANKDKVQEGYDRFKDVHHIIELHNTGDDENKDKNYCVIVIQDIQNKTCFTYTRLWAPLEQKQSVDTIENIDEIEMAVEENTDWSGDFPKKTRIPRALVNAYEVAVGVIDKIKNLFG